MTSDRCWHLRAHRRPCDAGLRPIIIIRSIVIIAVSTIMIVAAISSSTTTSNGTSGSSSSSSGDHRRRRDGGADRDGDSGDRRPGHGQSAGLFCVRDRYPMAETEVSAPLAFTGESPIVRVASATDRQSAAGSVLVALIVG